MALLAKSNVRNLKGSPSDPLVREVIISQTEQYSVKPPKSIWLPDLKIKTRFENYQRNWVLLISVAFCWFFKRLVKYVLDYRICCYCIFQFQFGNQDVFPMLVQLSNICVTMWPNTSHFRKQKPGKKEHKAKHIIHYKERVECHLWVWDDILHHVNRSEHLWGQFKSNSSREMIGVTSVVTHTSSLVSWYIIVIW